MMRSWRLTTGALALFFTVFLFVQNLHLYGPTSRDYLPPALGADVLPQLNFIGTSLRNGSAEQMQALFPEGYFFSYVLYGLIPEQLNFFGYSDRHYESLL